MPVQISASPQTLSGGRCPGCGLVTLPLRTACRRCGSRLAAHELSPGGQIEASTTVHVAASGFDAPYVLGYVKLDEGPRVLASIAMTSEAAAGRRVVLLIGAGDGLPHARPESP